jgi:hypothetical protein
MAATRTDWIRGGDTPPISNMGVLANTVWGVGRDASAGGLVELRWLWTDRRCLGDAFSIAELRLTPTRWAFVTNTRPAVEVIVRVGTGRLSLRDTHLANDLGIRAAGWPLFSNTVHALLLGTSGAIRILHGDAKTVSEVAPFVAD